MSIALVCRLVEEGLSISSIRKVLSGVAFLLRVGGVSLLGSPPLLRQMLYNSRLLRRHGAVRYRYLCCSVCCLSSLMFAILLLNVFCFVLSVFLAFFGAFRISELVAVNRFSPTGLLFSEISFCEEYLFICLCRSKTDQLGSGRWIRLNWFLGSELCPVEALRRFLDVRVVEGVALFCHEDGLLVTKFQFNSVLRRSLLALGWVGSKCLPIPFV